ncbi:pyridine nucleotide-disulfide oxidoreductase family protein [Delftia acidovorans]|jgi:electron-transferring-flavoprotein dehydrogenase|uniref:Electron transfer flavoprotein-ubiquinone oxidoreductase n=7 Tax=cellular organisms TaxID=131567 RepID=A0A2G7TAJ3_9FLAO|nr:MULTISPECIES: electron transfer flavoprotein-ubiquinone oxidoreductase [Delftia]APE49828.1 electron transfer flavoprotein-ubiquinone oxidoreductase [Delftia sp. HK171]EZP46923.1 Electron-transferring-flavoprotein dehydrogenase [Delftia sp. RIT313]KFJ13249.1 pyridine nucleotide-disulfide oxidoreductase family protein [Delftia acidovorans]MDH0420367.1 electron transfer flavoprotein-ubiquinone oxidoreductase [Delftia tsuruhatensis]OBY83588.1 electron transfer flavoprotein-ubiquinone oxidoreduc
MTNEEILAQYGPREAMEYDVVVVGGGPGGLATAIRLKQLAAEKGQDVSVVVLEKGSEPGAHILSGAIMDPRALTELIPDWKEKGAPLTQPVTDDAMVFLGEKSALRTPNFLLPACFQNHGNYIVRLGYVVKWLGEQAEALGVEIFPGFAAAEVLYNEDGSVKGVATGNMGIGKDGEPTGEFQLGMELHAKYTIFAEGSRGHLGKQIIAKYQLDAGKDPQSYGLGIKELWEIDPARHKPGFVMHTAGWPMDSKTYGGAFLYHLDDNKVTLGFITGLDYANPYLSPFEEFQRWKTHPNIRYYLEGDESKGIKPAKRLGYGARAITAGGLLSLPKFVFPGGALVGCDAGFLNVSRIKGSHAAIKTGMLAAEAAYDAIVAGRQGDELGAYVEAFENSWLYEELNKSRNFKAWFKKGLTTATLMNGIEQFVLKGNIPWTLHRDKPDHAYLKPAAECKPIDYPKPDGKLTFDRLSSVFISNTNHAEDQPAHLTLKDASVPVAINLAKYAGPEQRYCPAGVYEFVDDTAQGGKRLQINAQNCVHCKTCDIKDPTQNIVWVTPEGGGGPNYAGM